MQAVLDAGAGRDVLSYRTLKVLADLDPAVAEVTGFTRYRIDGELDLDRRPGRHLAQLTSRVERNPALVGTKHRVASEREVLVARGRRDGRTMIFVPEVKADTATGITLLHVRFHDQLDAATMRGVLAGLRQPLRPPRRLGDGDRGRLRRPPLGRAAGRSIC